MQLPLISAEDPADLLAAMAAGLGRVRDVWARHWLVMPGKGRAEWVQQQWARESGIASRSQHLSVRALVELAAAGDGRQPPFANDALALAVAGLIPEYGSRLPLAQVPETAAPIDGVMLAWGRQLADALDSGLLSRTHPDERFAQAPFLQELADDERLHGMLARHLGCMDDDAFREQCQVFMQHWQQREGLPYLWLHLDGGLPQVLWQRLLILLSLWPAERLRVFALNPSHQYWGDLRIGRGADAHNPGPILRAFGRRAQDLQEQLSAVSEEGSGAQELPSPSSGSSLLARLQTSCRQLQIVDADQPLAEDDVSFMVHGCRSPLRELEVIRDAILQQLASQPQLRPDDVLLLLADPDRHAPLIAAAFAAASDPQQRLPFRLTTGQGAQPAALCDAISALWQAVCGRCDQEALLQVLESPLVRARFQLQDYAGSQLLSWLCDARFSWGMDQAQRQQRQGTAGLRGHLAFALSRLAWGAIADPRQQQLQGDGVVPLERVSGLETAALADLAQLVHSLADQRQHWAEEQPANADVWCQRLEDLVEHCIAAEDTLAQQQVGQLLQHILPQLRRNIPAHVAMLGSAFRRLVVAQLQELHHQFGSGGGGVCVGALREWAGRPAAVVAICGLSDGAFPRKDERPGWHPLAHTRLPGDPSRRDDDRHALLLALLSAHKQCLCTYESGSLYDGNPRPPATPLQDLINAAQACAPASDHQRICHQRSLNGFAPQSIAADTPAPARSALPHDFQAGQAILTGRTQPQPSHGLWRSALATAPQEWRWKDCLAIAKEPLRGFLDALGLKLPEEMQQLHIVESLELDGLQEWQQRDRLLRHLSSGGTADELLRLRQCAGELGPGLVADHHWQTISKRLPKAEHIALARQPIDDDLGQLGLQHTISGNNAWQWYQDEQGCMTLHASKRQAPPANRSGQPVFFAKYLKESLEMLSLAARGYEGQARIYYSGKKHGPGAVLSMQLPSPGQACQALDAWCRMAGQACRVPIAWMPAMQELFAQAWEEQQGNFSDSACADLIKACQEAWTKSDFHSGAAADEPAAILALRGLDDPCAWLGPDNLDQYPLDLPGQGLPVSLRWCMALQHWQQEYLGSALQEERP